MSYIGRTPALGAYRKLDDLTSFFDGIQTNFTLTSATIPQQAGSPQNLIISLGGVIQEPGSAYTVNNTTIVFSTAPTNTQPFFGVQLGDVLDVVTVLQANFLSGNTITTNTTLLSVGSEMLLNTTAQMVGNSTANVTQTRMAVTVANSTNTAVLTATALTIGGTVANTSGLSTTGTLSVSGHPTLEGVTATGATGAGALVFGTSPTLVTPALGVPSVLTLTNATGLPIAGLTGLGTGVATALAIAVGSAGAALLFNGAGGTPSSMTGTNITGLPAEAILAGTFGAGAYTFPGALAITGAFTGATTGAFSGAITTGTINGQTISSAANFTGTMAVAGVLTVSGFGTHTFGTGGTGANSVVLLLDAGSASGVGPAIRWKRNSVDLGWTGIESQVLGTNSNALNVHGSSADGVSIQAVHGSGAIRFYAGGSTERGRVMANGAWVLGPSSAVDQTASVGGLTLADTGGLSMATWPITAAAANANLVNGNFLSRSTSIRANKHNERFITVKDARHTIMGLRGVLYQSRVDTDQRDWAGFIADDAEKVNPVLTTYDQHGVLQSFTYDRVPAYLVPVVQDHEARLAALEAKLKETAS